VLGKKEKDADANLGKFHPKTLLQPLPFHPPVTARVPGTLHGP
jgi:hypothetical protein